MSNRWITLVELEDGRETIVGYGLSREQAQANISAATRPTRMVRIRPEK